LKVAEITQTRQTPFTKGIPGPTWWKLFKARHPDLSICSSEVRHTESFKPVAVSLLWSRGIREV
jgi:hypothetical protein